MQDPLPEPANLRFLRRLVTVLTAVMILGITAIFVLIFFRVGQEPAAGNPAQTGPVLPEGVALPSGYTLRAVTLGEGWYALVADGPNGTVIRIHDAASGALIQTIPVTTP